MELAIVGQSRVAKLRSWIMDSAINWKKEASSRVPRFGELRFHAIAIGMLAIMQVTGTMKVSVDINPRELTS